MPALLLLQQTGPKKDSYQALFLPNHKPARITLLNLISGSDSLIVNKMGHKDPFAFLKVATPSAEKLYVKNKLDLFLNFLYSFPSFMSVKLLPTLLSLNFETNSRLIFPDFTRFSIWVFIDRLRKHDFSVLPVVT